LEILVAPARLDFVRFKAPAKVNLNLRVLEKLADGYHRIDSVMVPISLFDTVEITRTQTGAQPITVSCDQPDVPEGKHNIAYRAAARILEKQGVRGSVRVRIHKQIPVGAGLGGGSTDAAATMAGVNRIFRLGLGTRELAAMGAQIGSDVPFFIYGCPARVRGKGERVRPLRNFPTLWLVVLYPGFPVATAWAYQNVCVTLTKVVKNTSITASLRDKNHLGRVLTNDLERVTFTRHPVLAVLKDRLLAEGALGALMSGSGSSVFGIFDTEGAAQKAFHRLRKEEESRAYLVHSLS
jgi:4-diphosphocytidyl-2-C-methyl-D-erythritol kinase